MVFPSEIISDLPEEPSPSEDAPPPFDDSGSTPTDIPVDTSDTQEQAPEFPPSADVPPPSEGDTSGDSIPTDQLVELGPPSPGQGDTPPIPDENIGVEQPSPSPGPTQVLPAPNVNLPGVQGILDWLHNAIQSVEDELSKITSTIGDTLGAIIESIIPPEIAAITGLASTIGGLVEGLLNNLAPIGDVGQMAQDALTGGIPLAVQSFIDVAWEQRGDSISRLLEEIVNNPELPDNVKAPFAAISSGTSPIEKMLGIFGMAGLLAAVGHTILEPVLRKASQGANLTFRPEIPDLDTINDLFIRGLIDSQTYNATAARLGYPDNWIDQIRDANFREFPPEVLQDARNRGLFSDDDYAAHWRTLGFSGAQTALFDQVRWMVPTYTDLVHFMTRDAFFDTDDSPFGNVVRDFQLDFGEDTLPFDKFAQAGVPEQMARWAWRSHWEIPGRHDANEMFFRGTLGDRSPGGDGESVLRRVYRARGIEPRFIEPLISTAFHPLGRIDIRRLVKLGQMDGDAAIESYKQLGYNDTNAALLGNLAIQLATQESASEKEPFRSGLKQHIVTAYINGTLDRQEAENALTDLAYDTDKIAQFIAEAEVERHSELAGHIRQGVQKLFTSGEWQDDTARQFLQNNGFTDTEIDRLFDWWKPLRILSDLKADHKQHKEATRADILLAYTDDIIDRGNAHDHLANIGYNDDDIEMFLSEQDHKKQRADVTAELSAIQAAFLNREIDEQESIHELDALGINGNRRNSLIRKWRIELDKKQPELPLAIVEKLAIAKLYTIDELTDELHKRHFDAAQIAKFVRLWGYEIDVAAERIKTQSQREHDAEQRRQEAEQRRIDAEKRRDAAHIEAEKRHQEAEARRAIADSRRAESDRRAAQRESQTEHNRAIRDARQGRLSIGRIRTGYTVGLLSEIQAIQLMEAIGLRPETAELEIQIINEQQRAKIATGSGQSRTASVSQSAIPASV